MVFLIISKSKHPRDELSLGDRSVWLGRGLFVSPVDAEFPLTLHRNVY